MSVAVILLTLVIGLLLILYKRLSKLYSYWEERGVPSRKCYPFVGNMLENLLKKKTMGEIFRDIALEFKNRKFIGVYNFITADLLLTDAEDVQTVMVKEFSHFMDRGPKLDGKDFTDKHLMLLTGAEWKGVRAKVSPAFSSGKLKRMFPIMAKSYEYTSKYLDTLIVNNNVINSKDLVDTYILSVSASTIYGMDPARLADPNCEFKRFLDKYSTMNFRMFLSLTVTVFFPKFSKLLNILGLSTMKNEIDKFYINLVLNTFKERIESGEVKDDIIQQLLQLKQTGKIEVSQWINEDVEELGIEPSTINETVEITDQILVSQGFIFLMAGYDPLRTALSMLLLELSRNEDVAQKARKEVETVLAKHNGLTWQAVKEMQYLDWCISETLRLHPPTEMSGRYCVKDFSFSDGTKVEAGTRILIPTLKFHHDPTYFPEPEKFKPERFETPPPPTVFMPFGLGPRMCLARRFALQEMKLFAAKIVLDYDIAMDPKTELPVKTDKWYFLRRHVSEIYLKFNKRHR